MQKTEVESRAPHSLRRHPLHKAHVPDPDKTSPQYKALADSIHADGHVTTPLLITADGFVMDGWCRREIAADFQFDKVPCQIGESRDAAIYLVEPLVTRRQMTRGAAVYFALGCLEEYAEACDRRRLRNIAAGRITTEEQIGRLGSTPQALSSTTKRRSQQYYADRLGVSQKTFSDAVKVFLTLHDPATFKHWLRDMELDAAGIAGRQAELRAEFEPLLFNGEKSLWTILQAIAGRLTTADMPKRTHEQLDLFRRDFGAVATRWARLPAEQQERLTALLPATIADWSDDLLDTFETAIQKARKLRKASAA